jgi:hypothetical protein
MIAQGAMGAHHSARAMSCVWLTPPHILAALGPFDLDPCACTLPRPWPTAENHYTGESNGLLLPWFGRVWLNPPYGPPAIIEPWLSKMASHGRGIALIFARTETRAFQANVFQRAHAALFLAGRLHFHRPDGARAAANAGAPSVLVAYGADDAAKLAGCGLPGAYVRFRT